MCIWEKVHESESECVVTEYIAISVIVYIFKWYLWLIM